MTSKATIETNVVKKQRLEWVDYAKGIAAVLVVFLHVVAGVLRAGIWESDLATFLVSSWNEYSLNMPVFFMLAGLFAAMSIRKNPQMFIPDKIRTIAYPYVLWSLIAVVVGHLARPYTNFGVNLSSMPQILYNPVLVYWFMYAIFLTMLVYALFDRLKIDMRWFIALTALLYILVHVVDTDGWFMWERRLMRFAIFFAIGAAYSQQIRDLIAKASVRQLSLAGSAAFVVWLTFIGVGPSALPSLLQGIVSVLGVVALLSLCELLARNNALVVIRELGKRSLQIYVVHVIAAAGFRVVLQRFLGIDLVPLHLIGGVAAGVGAALFIDWFCNRIGFPYAFKFPKTTARTNPSVVQAAPTA
jgi:fucose 4-O-acetylase-like acetyltransferase